MYFHWLQINSKQWNLSKLELFVQWVNDEDFINGSKNEKTKRVERWYALLTDFRDL